jgi:hypothetical protein
MKECQVMIELCCRFFQKIWKTGVFFVWFVLFIAARAMFQLSGGCHHFLVTGLQI